MDGTYIKKFGNINFLIFATSDLRFIKYQFNKQLYLLILPHALLSLGLTNKFRAFYDSSLYLHDISTEYRLG
jgi:hypothetical protein